MLSRLLMESMSFQLTRYFHPSRSQMICLPAFSIFHAWRFVGSGQSRSATPSLHQPAPVFPACSQMQCLNSAPFSKMATFCLPACCLTETEHLSQHVHLQQASRPPMGWETSLFKSRGRKRVAQSQLQQVRASEFRCVYIFSNPAVPDAAGASSCPFPANVLAMLEFRGLI